MTCVKSIVSTRVLQDEDEEERRVKIMLTQLYFTACVIYSSHVLHFDVNRRPIDLNMKVKTGIS